MGVYRHGSRGKPGSGNKAFSVLYGIGLLPFPEGKPKRARPGSGIISTAQGQGGYRRGRLPTGAFVPPICRAHPRCPGAGWPARAGFCGIFGEQTWRNSSGDLL